MSCYRVNVNLSLNLEQDDDENAWSKDKDVIHNHQNQLYILVKCSGKTASSTGNKKFTVAIVSSFSKYVGCKSHVTKI